MYFLYLFISLLFTLYARIFHSYDGGEHQGGSKLDSTQSVESHDRLQDYTGCCNVGRSLDEQSKNVGGTGNLRGFALCHRIIIKQTQILRGT